MMKLCWTWLLFVAVPLWGQYRSETMWAFDAEIDSVVIRAAKSGLKKVEITVTPWFIDRNVPVVAGQKPEVKWIPADQNEPDSPFKKVTITWTILNDSLVYQEMKGFYGYGIIRNGHIYEYDRKKKERVHSKHYREIDSSGFRVTYDEYRHGKRLINATKVVYDSSGRVIEYQHSRPGIPVWYTKTEYPNDSTRIMRSYHMHTKDSLELSIETVHYSRTDVSGLHRTDSTLSTYQHPSRFTNMHVSRISYRYDNAGRLVAAEDLGYATGLSLYSKWELEIRYE